MTTAAEDAQSRDIIPVVLLGPNGEPCSGHRGIPCISVRYTFDAPVPEGTQSRLLNLRTARALLDTGADWNLINSDLIPAGLRPIEHLSSSGIGGEEWIGNHPVWLFFEALRLSQATGIATMTRRDGRPYDIILGRKFLQTTRFIYDGRDGVSLEYIGTDHVV